MLKVLKSTDDPAVIEHKKMTRFMKKASIYKIKSTVKSSNFRNIEDIINLSHEKKQ